MIKKSIDDFSILENKKENEDKNIKKHKKNTISVDMKKIKQQDKNIFKSKLEEINNPLRNLSYNKKEEIQTTNNKKTKEREKIKTELNNENENKLNKKIEEQKMKINNRKNNENIIEGPLKNILRNSDGKRIIRNLDDKSNKVVRFSINENNKEILDLLNKPSIIVLSKKNSKNNNLRYNDEDNSNEETKDSSKDALFIKKINNTNNNEKNKLNLSYDQKNHIKKLIDQKRILKLNPLSKSMNLNKYGDDFDKFVENFDETEISDANLILSSDLDDIYKNIYDDSLEFKNDVFFKGLRHLDEGIGLFDKKK